MSKLHFQQLVKNEKLVFNPNDIACISNNLENLTNIKSHHTNNLSKNLKNIKRSLLAQKNDEQIKYRDKLNFQNDNPVLSEADQHSKKSIIQSRFPVTNKNNNPPEDEDLKESNKLIYE